MFDDDDWNIDDVRKVFNKNFHFKLTKILIRLKLFNRII